MSSCGVLWWRCCLMVKGLPDTHRTRCPRSRRCHRCRRSSTCTPPPPLSCHVSKARYKHGQWATAAPRNRSSALFQNPLRIGSHLQTVSLRIRRECSPPPPVRQTAGCRTNHGDMPRAGCADGGRVGRGVGKRKMTKRDVTKRDVTKRDVTKRDETKRDETRTNAVPRHKTHALQLKCSLHRSVRNKDWYSIRS